MRFAGPLIVGGGPAGSAAAIVLARGEARPTILERQTEIGDAICGGFLSWRTLERLGRLGVTDLGGHRVATVGIFADKQRITAALPAPAMGLTRHRLDTALLETARHSGARIEYGSPAKSLDGSALQIGSGVAEADALFIATGKHDLRGLGRPRAGEPTLGLRLKLGPHPALTRLIGDAIELHLFDGGYVGIVLQDDGKANLCLAVRKSRLMEAGGKPERLILDIAEGTQLADRLAFLNNPVDPDAIAAIPYGWRTAATRPGVFRLGDQAAVIPSLAGEGIDIAIASGMAAAETYLRVGSSGAQAFQADFARRTRRPVTLAGWLWAACENPRSAGLAMAAARRFPTLVDWAARMTRVGD